MESRPLDKATATSNGYISHIEPHRLAGWATSSLSTAPCRVDLYLADHLIASCLADLQRPEVQAKGLHPSGRCGFQFTISAYDLDANIGDLQVYCQDHPLEMVAPLKRRLGQKREHPFGALTGIHRHCLKGWVARKQGKTPVQLDLYYRQKKIQTLTVVLCPTKRFRQKREDTASTTAAIPFCFHLPEIDCRREFRHIDIVFGESGEVLPFSPRLLTRLPPSQETTVTREAPFFFMHIPKTAGTSFGKMLADLFADRHVVLHYGRRRGLCRKKAEVVHADLLIGHLPYYGQRILSTKPRRLVFLRDPVDRVISLLMYLQKRRKAYHHLDLSEIFAKEKHGCANFQVRLFLNQPPPPLLDTLTLSLAKAQLRDFDFIGLTEKFDTSVRLAERQFGWVFPRVLQVNVTDQGQDGRMKSKREMIDPDLLQAIIHCNRLDIRFYNYGKSLFASRLKAVFPEDACLAQGHATREV